jgi:predicted  nucleic acid-binding Zn-ribbon protein
MEIAATREDIRALLELAELDRSPEPVVPEAQARAREAAERRVPDELLTRYRWLAATGRFPVLVAVEQETCSGCHVRLATMIAYRLKRSVGISACPRCRRMLYAPELLSERPAEGDVKKKARSRRGPGHTSAHRP